ncbi:hypothetical protein EDEG_00546 [Edhazardia aedis USNM 41457]|uniref:Magnesium and cobalt transporter CorA n=1 Tax=Edhazardia aedis (strain USNM 41457) TaxID=1003232 RepID=J9D051_EDHAE|nr:hypothetical protein EDEG_00546 [Edhazardia aedis USNM 41457]|eukprot:EJW01246.1 hypothetical protein EDEG_00546 [Edhazardia aedis USNM 41457]
MSPFPDKQNSFSPTNGKNMSNNIEEDMESTANMITEIITIYRKMKKGRDNQNIYRPLLNIRFESLPVEPIDIDSPTFVFEKSKNTSVYDFSRFRNIKETKYIYYSKETSLLQSNFMFDMENIIELVSKKFYWINIFNPNEKDLNQLANLYDVHDITLIDIREKNTEEKIEIFKHYTFISLRLFGDPNCEEAEDIDFNILMFKDFIITTHDKPWVGINDILNFMSLISNHSTPFPEWVLYSVIIEFLQDLKSIKEDLRPKVERMQDISHANENTIEDLLRTNFALVYRLHNLKNTIKPKLNIINSLKTKCNKRLRKLVSRHLIDSHNDFYEQEQEVKEYQKILERSQDLGLAIVNMVQSREGNAMNKSMKWFTMVTFIFLPCQTVAGLWGMNVRVPGQGTQSLIWFYILCFIGPIISLCYCYVHKCFKSTKQTKKKWGNYYAD